MHKLLVCVDTQFDFVMPSGALYVPGAEQIIQPGIEFLARLSPADYAAALFTFDSHDETFEGSPENLGDPASGVPGFPMHCAKGTPGWQNVFNPAIVPSSIPIHQLHKGVFDMWEEASAKTPVHPLSGDGCALSRDDFFEALPDTVRVATVIGVASDFCVRWAINGLLAHGFAVEVVAQLTRGIAREIATVVAEEFPGRVTLI